jgi:hypothetical protein
MLVEQVNVTTVNATADNSTDDSETVKVNVTLDNDNSADVDQGESGGDSDPVADAAGVDEL